MYGTMTRLVDVLDSMVPENEYVVPWACPVPFFGDISSATIATVGINPSNREFVDVDGARLRGVERRLPTLESLGKPYWSELDGTHLRILLDECRNYFARNPYDRWFGALEQIIAGVPATFYGRRPSACHLDLVPYATVSKWGALEASTRGSLLASSRNALGELLRDSRISTLILNGASVVREFEVLTGVALERSVRHEWTLPRASGSVVGYGYSGRVARVGTAEIGRDVRVLGYNHNLQSSFGVTRSAKAAIASWIAREAMA